MRWETYNFTGDFQDTIIACLIRYPDEFYAFGEIIKAQYFDGAAAHEMVHRALEYKRKYGKFPNFGTLANFAYHKAARVNEDHAIETLEYIEKLAELDTSDKAAILDLSIEFAKERALYDALKKIHNAQIEGKRDEINPAAIISEALSVGERNLRERLFNPNIEPPPLLPVFSLVGTCISTPGNLTTITSTIKTGKSACIGAMAAAAMPHTDNADLLGFESSNHEAKALLWFDSEQSKDDHWYQVHRALKRAGLQSPPPWFYSYYLTGLGYQRGWNKVLEEVRRAAAQHGGLHSILLDGVADFVSDVNDSKETSAFVATLQDMAIQHDCAIVGVIHFNPGSEKTRGHLGSQMERKAETNLRLDKADGVTVIWSDKQRRAPIPKNTGPCFQWSDEAGMHVSVQNTKASKEELERESLSILAEGLFTRQTPMRYADLHKAVKSELEVSDKSAERRIKRMTQLRVIKKSTGGRYEFAF
jgi:hypothetical protein